VQKTPTSATILHKNWRMNNVKSDEAHWHDWSLRSNQN